MKIKIVCLLVLFVGFASCKDAKTANIEHKELLVLADSLELKQNEYDDLIDSVNTLNKKSDLFYRKIHIQKKEIDRLRSRNKILSDENKRLTDQNKKAPISKAEKAIQNMVFKMHDAWASIAKSKDPKEVLVFFNKKYLINRITIEADDTASVARFSQDDYEEYIRESILSIDGFSVEFADVDFLDIEIKDDAYFNVAYKCVMGSYVNDRLHETNSLLVTITGKNIDGEWGISSYSWVNFKYGE
ncbi:hypothetical protein [Flavicella marina]|uniref:hypothetical protein n=1 Tax=Flavicella marina TaxID=1475951 RepID=UPI001265A2DC|nr:hypothetical protein [Flavicella marina]